MPQIFKPIDPAEIEALTRPECRDNLGIAALVRIDFPHLDNTALVHGERSLDSDATLYGLPFVLVNSLSEGESIEAAVIERLATTYGIETPSFSNPAILPYLSKRMGLPKLSRYIDRDSPGFSVLPMTVSCEAVSPAKNTFADRVLLPLGTDHIRGQLKRTLEERHPYEDPLYVADLLSMNTFLLNAAKRARQTVQI